MNKKLKYKQKYIQREFLGKGKCGQVYKVQKIQNKASPQSSPSLSKSSQSQPQKQFYAAKRVCLYKIDYQAAKKQLQILEHLKHMYIVRFYEDFIQNQQLIIIMDYCQGKDLQFLIQDMKKKGKYFNQSIVSTWIFQLILVMEYIHSCNIIHRDIKPQNIFVDKDMNLKIGDFGVSKLLEGTQNCKTTAGTPMYFSPELIKGEPYSKKTDIWSLGCVIYEICTLQRPFHIKGTGFFQLMSAIQNNEPKNIPKIYSQDLNKLIRKMLTKDAKKRPSARQLLQDPILVQLMINYSSQVNLKQEYQKKPLQKPTLTDSFIQVQSNAVNQRMLKFQQEVRLKMQSLKNKKVKSSEIQKYYEDIQNKMKNLQKIVDTAFKQLKSRCDQIEEKSQPKTLPQSQFTNKSAISQNNSSRLSESDATIKSVNLSQKSQKLQNKSMSKKQMQQKILSMPLDQSSSIDSVNSIFLQSNKNLKISKPQQQKLQKSFGRTSRSNQLSQMILSKKDKQDLQDTLKTQYLQTIKNTHDVNQLKDLTLQHIQEIAKEIKNNPNLILDQSFLDVTLSVSNNQLANNLQNAMKKKNVDPETSIGRSYSSSGKTLNFDFTKKQLIDTLSVSKKTVSDKTVSEGEKDSLDQYYEPDFEVYEQDQQLDIRQQQRKNVKQLFASTLKNLTMVKNDSSTSNSSIQPRNKYSLTLSTIRQQSSQGGSTISYHQDVE